MPNAKTSSGRLTPESLGISVMSKLQRLSEQFLLVGLAIAIRKKLESCAISREADIDTEAHCRIGFHSTAQNLIPFFRPSSRL